MSVGVGGQFSGRGSGRPVAHPLPGFVSGEYEHWDRFDAENVGDGEPVAALQPEEFAVAPDGDERVQVVGIGVLQRVGLACRLVGRLGVRPVPLAPARLVQIVDVLAPDVPECREAFVVAERAAPSNFSFARS